MSTDTTNGRTSPTRRRGGLLTTILTAVVAVAVGLGAGWLLFSADTVDPEIDQLVRDYMAAWDIGDGDAAVALMTADGVHYSWARPDGMSGDELADSITQLSPPYDYKVIGDTMISTDGPTREVAFLSRVGLDDEHVDFVMLVTVVDTDDGPRIAVSTTEKLGYTVAELNG